MICVDLISAFTALRAYYILFKYEILLSVSNVISIIVVVKIACNESAAILTNIMLKDRILLIIIIGVNSKESDLHLHIGLI